jgi:hypothetical protein
MRFEKENLPSFQITYPGDGNNVYYLGTCVNTTLVTEQ